MNAELITAPAQALEFMGADRHVGGRAYQQDQVVCLSTPDLKYQLLVVADGVGGHSGGEMASKAVIDVARRLFPAHLSQFSESGGFLEQFCQTANHEIRARAAQENHEAFSTVVALLTTPERAYWAHVGDSRLYGFKGNWSTKRLTILSCRLCLIRGKSRPTNAGFTPNVIECLMYWV